MHRLHLPLLAAAGLVLAACAPTTIRDSWHDPEYRGAAFRSVLVLGVFPNIAERRQFEDVMAATIGATGARGIPAYRFLPGQERASEADLDRAVRESGRRHQDRAVRLALGMPLVDHPGGEIWEVRTKLGNRIARVLFPTEGHTMVLLHGFIKKQQKAPGPDLDLAIDRVKQLKRR